MRVGCQNARRYLSASASGKAKPIPFTYIEPEFTRVNGIIAVHDP